MTKPVITETISADDPTKVSGSVRLYALTGGGGQPGGVTRVVGAGARDHRHPGRPLGDQAAGPCLVLGFFHTQGLNLLAFLPHLYMGKLHNFQVAHLCVVCRF